MNEPSEGHTVKRYDTELAHLHDLASAMGQLVLGLVHDAVRAFKGVDLTLAQSVMGRDAEIDRLELVIDREVITLLARRAPLGGDLRWIIAISKSVSDLERTADEAVRIARTVIQQFGSGSRDVSRQVMGHVAGITNMAIDSLQDALKLLESRSEEQAEALIAKQRAIDEEFQSELRRLMTYVLEDARTIGPIISVMLIIKSLERIGHYAQNLAEYALFQIEGDARGAQHPPDRDGSGDTPRAES
ncbi:MAG: phosphate signaling complex protein PhoU [Gammaproteobacteria bacterium]|nr:phosphate signaling complex protein PhoU [Gammaproteobacteria bacterium]